MPPTKILNINLVWCPTIFPVKISLDVFVCSHNYLHVPSHFMICNKPHYKQNMLGCINHHFSTPSFHCFRVQRKAVCMRVASHRSTKGISWRWNRQARRCRCTDRPNQAASACISYRADTPFSSQASLVCTTSHHGGTRCPCDKITLVLLERKDLRVYNIWSIMLVTGGK